MELNSYELYSSSMTEWNMSRCVFTMSPTECCVRTFHITVVWWTSMKCTKKCAAQADVFFLLFFDNLIAINIAAA